MKHIKGINATYWEISYGKSLFDNINFDVEEYIPILENYFKEYFKRYGVQIQVRTKYYPNGNVIGISGYKKYVQDVIVLPDEWFIVRNIGDAFYKCDQLEGLLDCLKYIYTL